jgi:hypothetical protein
LPVQMVPLEEDNGLGARKICLARLGKGKRGSYGVITFDSSGDVLILF